MKRILLSLVIAIAALGASAQSYWGVRAAWDYTMPTKWKSDVFEEKMFAAGSGIYAGAVFNYPIVAGLYIEPGAGLYYNTGRFDDFTIIADEGANIFDPKIKKFGVRIPVRLGYYFDIFPSGGGVSVFTGPQVDLGISGRVSDREGSDMEFPHNLYSDFYSYRRFGLSWTVGADIYIGSCVVDICGSIGLTDLHKGMGSIRENRISVGLGYNF